MEDAFGRRNGKQVRRTPADAASGGWLSAKRPFAPPALPVCALLLLVGCGVPRGGASPGPADGSAEAERAEASPQTARDGFSCASRPVPFAHLGTAALVPDTVKPGESVTHRIVYTLCNAGGAPVSGRLRTRILRGSATVLIDAVPDHRLKPGSWTVDATVKVPPGAEEGPYRVVVDFAGNAVGEDFAGPVTFVRAVELNVRR